MGSDNSGSRRISVSGRNFVGASIAVFLILCFFLLDTAKNLTDSNDGVQGGGVEQMDQLLKRDAEEVELLKDLKYKIEGNIATMAKEKNKIYDDMMKEDSRQGGGNPVSPSVPSNILESSAPNNPQITVDHPKPPEVAPTGGKNGSGQNVYFSSSADNPMLNPQLKIVHFPCPLRDDPDPAKCRLECEDADCTRAGRICSNYIECSHIVYDGNQGEDLKGKYATLMHEVVEEGLGGSTAGFEKWGPKLTKDQKPRTYVIISYGGSGSKMLSGWISDLPKSSVVTVKHMHDPNPPAMMTEFGRPLREASHEGDYRNRHIPGGLFNADLPKVDEANYDDYRYIYIFKDPVEGLVSRYGYGHCMHVGGDCGKDDKGFPNLEQYANDGKDFFKISDFFDHWTTEGYGGRKYPVITVNYHKIWDNVPAVVEALGLPSNLASTFPKRTETVRNNKTGAKEGHMNHSEQVRDGLRKIYRNVLDEIRAMPAINIV